MPTARYKRRIERQAMAAFQRWDTERKGEISVRSVVRLVKDTMSRPTNEPLDSRASDLFYNDLYVQLTQRLQF